MRQSSLAYPLSITFPHLAEIHELINSKKPSFTPEECLEMKTVGECSEKKDVYSVYIKEIAKSSGKLD
jgi:hypothetical protein